MRFNMCVRRGFFNVAARFFISKTSVAYVLTMMLMMMICSN